MGEIGLASVSAASRWICSPRVSSMTLILERFNNFAFCGPIKYSYGTVRLLILNSAKNSSSLLLCIVPLQRSRCAAFLLEALTHCDCAGTGT